MGLVTAAAAPSVATIYRRQLAMDGALFLAVSQSGRSPDLVRQAEMAAAGGARTVALVNDPGSPLAVTCQHVLPPHAGQEASVAATKSYITSLDRKSVGQGKSVSGRVDLCGRRFIKKQNNQQHNT